MASIEGVARSAGSRDPRRTPRVREAAFSDYPQIAAVQARNGLAVRSQEDWVRLWQGNPAYDGEFPIGWVLETGGGEIVGTIGNLPCAYYFRGALLRAAAATDWAVDRPYRASSLSLLHRLSNQPGVDLLICTTVSASSEPGYRALRWPRAPAGNWDSAGFWITGYRGFLASTLRKHGAPLAGVLSYPASLALACRDRWNGRRLQVNHTGCRIEIQPQAGPPFQKFWEALKAENEGVLLGLRTPAFLGWHMRESLARQGVWVATASEGSRLVAYAIAKRHDSPSYGLKRLRLVDAQALHGFERTLQAALSCLLTKCRAEGIHVLEDVGCWLDRLGNPAPYYRTFPAWAYYYKAVSPELAQALADPAVWAPTALDGDQAL